MNEANQQGQGDRKPQLRKWNLPFLPPKRVASSTAPINHIKSVQFDKDQSQPQTDTVATAPEQFAYQHPKAATWENNSPTEAWCPEHISEHLEWAKTHQASDNLSKADTAFHGWKVLGATRRGKMHAHNGSHREDAFAFKIGDCYTILCVSDGAGASQFSRIGSELACRELISHIATSCEEQKAGLRIADEGTLANSLSFILQQNIYKTLEAFHNLAAKTNISPNDFRCTILLTLLYEAESATVAVVGQVGDGFIGFAEKTNFTRLDSSASGDFSGEVKCFMPDEKTCEYFEESLKKCGVMIQNGLIKVSNLEAILLCTDGIEDPFFPIEKNLETLFCQLKNGFSEPLPDFVYDEGVLPLPPALNSPETKGVLEKWLSFQKRGENDDRTILLIYRELKPAEIHAEGA